MSQPDGPRGAAPAAPDAVPATVEVRRSARRRRTVQARVEGDTVVVLMPAGLSPTQEQRHVSELLDKLRRSQRLRRLRREDDLLARAGRLSATYLDGRAVPASVTWVSNQGARWGSCSVRARTIRLSADLDGMPTWVLDAVLLHELAHLVVLDHGPRFQELVGRYPRYQRASGFLSGVSFAGRRPDMALDDDAIADPAS